MVHGSHPYEWFTLVKTLCSVSLSIPCRSGERQKIDLPTNKSSPIKLTAFDLFKRFTAFEVIYTDAPAAHMYPPRDHNNYHKPLCMVPGAIRNQIGYQRFSMPSGLKVTAPDKVPLQGHWDLVLCRNRQRNLGQDHNIDSSCSKNHLA